MFGGLLTILQELPVEKIIICKQGENSENYEQFKQITQGKKIYTVKKEDEIIIEKNLKLQILWPKEELIKENILNNNSIVAKINYKNFSMLFTGDIEEIAEKQIVQEYKNTNLLKSTILKVGHHGSDTSSSSYFINVIKPKYSIISVGKNNSYGHPKKEVLKNLLSSKVYRTDILGTIEVILTKKSSQIKTFPP